MAVITFANIPALMKETYTHSELNELLLTDHALMAVVPKDPTLVGKNAVFPISYGFNLGRSATFTTAQSLNGIMKNEAIQCRNDGTYSDLKHDYSILQLDRMSLDLANSDRGSFLDLLRGKQKMAFESLAKSLSNALYGPGTGLIGTLSSVGGTYDIVLTDRGQAANFYIGQSIYGIDSASYKAAADWIGHVVSVDMSIGGINIAKDSGAQVPDTTYKYMFAAGDMPLASGSYTKVHGLASWCPITAPTGAFMGIAARELHTVLKGNRLVGTGYGSRKEALMDIIAYVRSTAKSPKVGVLHPLQWNALQKELDSNVQYTKIPAQGFKGELAANIGFDAIRVAGCDFMQDNDCPVGYSWVFSPEELVLLSSGEVPKILEEPFPIYNSDSKEFRTGYYAQLICKNPGSMGIVSLPAL